MHPRGTVEVRVVPVGIKLKKEAVDRAAPRSVSDVRKVLRSPQWFRQPWQDRQGRETQKYCDVRDQIELGAGEAVYDAARAALRRWQQLRLGWVDVWSPDTPLEVGQVVAIMGWAAGFWWLNACRIAYTTDESGPTSKFGFAYGTLTGMWNAAKNVF